MEIHRVQCALVPWQLKQLPGLRHAVVTRKGNVLAKTR